MPRKENKRAANGMGTIRERKDGVWEARYTAADGRQRSIYAKSRPEAKAKLKKRMAELTLGVWFEPSKITVDAWAKTWLSDYTKHVKLNTYQSYESIIKTHIIPALGSKRLAGLKTIHIQRMLNDIADKDTSTSSLKSIKIVLSSMLGAAVKFGLINLNPCNGVTIAKIYKKPRVIIDRKDIPGFIAEAKKSIHGDAMLLILQTGLRTGELRGLRWSDFHEAEKKLYVNRQIVISKNGPIIQTTKTGENRSIILMDETVALLREHKKRQAELRIKNGGWQDTEITNDLIFRLKSGACYSANTLYYAVTKVGKALGIDGLHPHSLRDSYAVAALRAGVDIKTVQNNLGHANAAMTLNTYATYTDDMGRVAANKLSEYWRENSTR